MSYSYTPWDWNIYAYIDPPGTTPGLIGSPMAVPDGSCRVFDLSYRPRFLSNWRCPPCHHTLRPGACVELLPVLLGRNRLEGGGGWSLIEVAGLTWQVVIFN